MIEDSRIANIFVAMSDYLRQTANKRLNVLGDLKELSREQISQDFSTLQEKKVALVLDVKTRVLAIEKLKQEIAELYQNDEQFLVSEAFAKYCAILALLGLTDDPPSDSQMESCVIPELNNGMNEALKEIAADSLQYKLQISTVEGLKIDNMDIS